MLVCSKVNLATQTVVPGNIKYEHIYGNVEDQKAIVTIFKELNEKRNMVLKPDPNSGSEHWTLAPPGAVQTHPDNCTNICSVCIGN